MISVTSTKSTKTGLTKGATYAVYCTSETFFLPGSNVTAGVDGTSGQPIPAKAPMWITLKNHEASISFITASGVTSTCYLNKWS